MILICTDLKILNDKRVLSQVITTALIENSHKMAAPNRMRSLTNPENRENSAGLHGNFTLLFIYQSQRVQRNTRLQITTTKYL